MTTSPTRQLKMSEVFAVPSRLRAAVRTVRQGVVAGGRGGFAGRERAAISSLYSAATRWPWRSGRAIQRDIVCGAQCGNSSSAKILAPSG